MNDEQTHTQRAAHSLVDEADTEATKHNSSSGYCMAGRTGSGTLRKEWLLV
jgi:hypothetical protein